MNNKSTTKHKLIEGASQRMTTINDNSIELVVTSPPYPMIEMWDEIMSDQNLAIKEALTKGDGVKAFDLMHLELDKVWKEVERVLIPGGFACINIGDATRNLDGKFSLYPNHSKIILSFQKLGMHNLPNIIWRKQTNAPNKFMGSGMLPSGAYVTLEHEWILVFRKGLKRNFKTEQDKERRRESSFFWEERNIWFSDLWEVKGTKQQIMSSETRKRSGAFPIEIPYRLINMYSLQGDTVLDPFLGTGTTTIAAIAACRNSVGYDIDCKLLAQARDQISNINLSFYNSIVENRIIKHFDFIRERQKDVKKDIPKHYNYNLETSVITSQETKMKFSKLSNVYLNNLDEFVADYIGFNSASLFDKSLI